MTDDRWRFPRPSEVRKAIIALLGFGALMVSTILAVGPELIPPDALPWVQIGLSVLGTYGVWKIKNAPTTGG